MRTILTICAASAIWCCAQAADQYVYVREGTVACKPRDLPSVGVRLDTGDVVLGLHGADAALRAACGWLPVVEDPAPAAGMRIASQAWVVEDGTARLVRTYEPRPPRSYELSKYRLVEGIASAGKLPEFMAWISADPAVRFRWDAAVTLDETNVLIQAAMAMLPAVLDLPAERMEAIMQAARITP